MAVGARSGGPDGPDRRPSSGSPEADEAGADHGGRGPDPDGATPRGAGDESGDMDGRTPGPAEPGEGEDGGREGRGRTKNRSFWKELPILIGVALVLALLIKTFLLQAFSIPSDSMQNTLQRGDRVLVDKLTPWFGATPDRGEVIVFRDPGGWLPPPVDEGGFWPTVQEGLSQIGLMPSAEDQNLIKRVIAVGGDTVECQEGGPVTVNGVAVQEMDFIFPGNSACDDRPFGPIDIPEGRLWVMGDHRQDSQDSRFHMNGPGGGTVSEDSVVGRAIVVAWPINRWSVLSVPEGYSSLDNAMAVAVPGALGVAGAVPLVLLRRHLVNRPQR
ncbi:signal peptidase I [Streptomyces lonarensis]|uniref:Signal peptidase I n=1 Tax=Streptomyces lonarensis TaxID=700599 RepID=A0A7X6HXH9_9ACTN|nr:signal peptidase I [Streptomyces lonarensis]NJQ04561.1 signal peptidase I [Streptomyces lonarensis]